MKESNLQVCTEEVSKSYTIETVSFSSPVIQAFVAAGYRFLHVTSSGSVSVCREVMLMSWQHIEYLPAPDEYGYYDLQLENVVYKIW